MAELREHYRPTNDAHDSGVYRVVGATGDVTLLRITDTEGKRVHTGEIRRVSTFALDTEFERAEDPDAGFTPVLDVQNALSGLYWQVRKFL